MQHSRCKLICPSSTVTDKYGNRHSNVKDDEVYEIEFGPFWKDEDNFIWPKL